MLRAIVFDLDDTLYEEEQFIFSGFRQVAQYLEAKDVVGDSFWSQLREVYQQGVRGKIFDEALVKVGVTPEVDLIAEMLQVYRSHKPNIELYPDARQILGVLNGQYRLGLLSDGYAHVQRNKVAALGLRDSFHAIVFSDELGRGCWKPSPKPYRRMLDVLEVTAGEALYVGDNPAKDFITARKTGWWTVQVKRANGQYGDLIPEPGYQAHYEVSNLLEIPSLPIEGLTA